MKSVYIIIAVLVIVGFGFFIFDGDNDQVPAIEVVGESLPVNNAIDTVLSEDVVNEPGDETGVGPESEVTNLTDETGISEVANKTFTIDSFSFGYSETEIKVKEGDTVTINLTNSDGFHDWVVDEFDAATDKIRVGETTSITFVADKVGTFEYYCSVGSHRVQGMVGKLIVE